MTNNELLVIELLSMLDAKSKMTENEHIQINKQDIRDMIERMRYFDEGNPVQKILEPDRSDPPLERIATALENLVILATDAGE